MKRFALCIHDLRLSDGEEIKQIIETVIKRFEVQLITLHLIVDTDIIEENKPAIDYLIKKTKNKELEIVFHGAHHFCKDKPWKSLSWFHKYEAEFLSGSFDKEINTRRFTKLKDLIKNNLGICPPCWMASIHGWSFLQSLNPLYNEKMFFILKGDKRTFSPILSLGSDLKKETKLLILLLKVLRRACCIFGSENIRVVIHKKDIPFESSLNVLYKSLKVLKNKGYKESIQYELIKE